MNSDAIWITLTIVVVLIAIAFPVWKKLHPRTVESEKRRISKILRGFTNRRKYQLLDHPVLVSKSLSGWADHIVVGYFGVLLVYDLCFEGEYYGKADETRWKLISGGVKYEFESPFVAADQCTGRVQTLLRDAGFKIPVERVAVITLDTRGTYNYVKSDELILRKHLHSYLGREKFSHDNDVDIEAVAQVLKNALKAPAAPESGEPA